MNNYLKSIAEQVLLTLPGVSKVRFAKTIYYVHKALVTKNLANINDLEFIRMPLGPVPVGFMELGNESNINVTSEKGELEYNTQVYELKESLTKTSKEQREVISSVSRRLNKISTSVLVALSHKEPSWLEHNNGDKYFVSKADLKRVLRVPPSKKMDKSRDYQLLQARLLNGMLKEIVEESTSLEYPDEKD